jgi:hypothetical protein
MQVLILQDSYLLGIKFNLHSILMTNLNIETLSFKLKMSKIIYFGLIHGKMKQVLLFPKALYINCLNIQKQFQQM